MRDLVFPVPEREMARLKEQSRIERERRHLEKQAKRKLEDEDGTSNKRVNVGDGVIAVSDNSDNESDTEKYQLQNYAEEKSDRSNNESEIASRSPSIHGGRRTSDDEDRTDRSRSRSRSRHSSDSDGSRRSRSERSRSRSSSREEQLRLQPRSPKSNGNTVADDVAKTEEKKEEVCFPIPFTQTSTLYKILCSTKITCTVCLINLTFVKS